MSLLSLEHISVAYNNQLVLEDFNLNIEQGQLVSLLGPSGCGKTTTLRLIAGFLDSKDGKFMFGGKDYTRMPVNKRNFGFVFQSYALFPHLSVYENVAFGLRMRKVKDAEVKQRVMRILEVVSLGGFEGRYPRELSGGQRQRVAIARALVIEPELLLFDEPLSNLDANLRVNMRVEIRRIQQELGITTVYVSHDQEECFSISDRVAIMNKGNIEQLDAPAKIFRYPASEYVARFIGFQNFLEFASRREENGEFVLNLGGREFKASRNPGTAKSSGLKGAFRPDDLLLLPQNSASDELDNVVPGIIKVSTYLGRSYQYVVDTEFGEFTVNQEMDTPYLSGQRINLAFPQDRMVLVD
ncbi:spermidine/putrescine ABC transporter ATP-binding protein [Paenibacillus yonginensis]|uniref:Carnitine transport ATP-binding protein OpuCA n=1 Tax=Paenibacillus yonginensis TaxID=1462996 RepID=A0A1B1N000_9BACL|nr:ABC transporter ATP-binding protein [Paenibacillus yonginensis]ANS74752.1 spermidine/putrescine ABC transporter ATP-binding protein [Paenibacillus yonginensis]